MSLKTNYKDQLRRSILYKTIAIASSYLTIPLTLKYLNISNFGVWATVLTIISWVSFFDLGIGNSLRNQHTILIQEKKTTEIKKLFSTTYTLVGLISLFILFVFFTLIFMLNWQYIFNTKQISEVDLKVTLAISAGCISLNFWMNCINSIYSAEHKTDFPILGQAITNLSIFASVYLVSTYTKSSIIFIAVCYGIGLILGSAILNFNYFFKNPDLIPKFEIHIKELNFFKSTGYKYFIIQLNYLILFTTDKIIITQISGPESVTLYDITMRLFTVFTIGYTLTVNPLWSSIAEKYSKRHINEINSTLHFHKLILSIVVTMVIFSNFLMQDIINIWLGKKIEVPVHLILAISISTCLTLINMFYTTIANSLDLLKTQTALSIISMILNIPLSIILGKFLDLGATGVVLGTAICLIPFVLLIPGQIHKKLNLNNNANF